MTKTVSEISQELADREAIRDCLFRYCRGIDRCDEELLRGAYWPGATDDHPEFSGSAEAFIAWVVPQVRSTDQTMHMLGNILIEINGSKAAVESYFHAYHRVGSDGAKFDSIVSGRYLDNFERRDGVWRIARRKVVRDWARDYGDSADWAGLQAGDHDKYGGRKPEDKSYAVFAFVR